jgi:hypothetical protein
MNNRHAEPSVSAASIHGHPCVDTTLREAKMAVARGVDALVVQGLSVGGHRGTFDATVRPSSEPLSELACGSISAEGFDRIVTPAIMIGPFSNTSWKRKGVTSWQYRSTATISVNRASHRFWTYVKDRVNESI